MTLQPLHVDGFNLATWLENCNNQIRPSMRVYHRLESRIILARADLVRSGFSNTMSAQNITVEMQHILDYIAILKLHMQIKLNDAEMHDQCRKDVILEEEVNGGAMETAEAAEAGA